MGRPRTTAAVRPQGSLTRPPCWRSVQHVACWIPFCSSDGFPTPVGRANFFGDPPETGGCFQESQCPNGYPQQKDRHRQTQLSVRSFLVQVKCCSFSWRRSSQNSLVLLLTPNSHPSPASRGLLAKTSQATDLLTIADVQMAMRAAGLNTNCTGSTSGWGQFLNELLEVSLGP